MNGNLICDEHGLYEKRSYKDRMLLGLKGKKEKRELIKKGKAERREAVKGKKRRARKEAASRPV